MDVSNVADAVVSRPGPGATIEGLENRTLLSTAPTVVSFTADNRAQAVIKFSEKLDADTVTKDNVRMYKAGADKKFGTKDDVLLTRKLNYSAKERTITVTGKLKPNKAYRVVVTAKITDRDGEKLDGEFNGNDPSGDGRAGGRFEFRTKRATKQVAMFQTVLGTMHVKLFADETPITVENFYDYANSERWDNTFFHRSAKNQDGDNFVIQGGGFFVNDDNEVDEVETDPAITNEPGISNTRGTIAMARTNVVNSATSQWFFNLSDENTFLDTQNEGFTVFGEVTSKKSLRIMDAIADLPVNHQFSSPFGELPVTSEEKQDAVSVSPKKDFVIVRRISIRMDARAV